MTHPACRAVARQGEGEELAYLLRRLARHEAATRRAEALAKAEARLRQLLEELE